MSSDNLLSFSEEQRNDSMYTKLNERSELEKFKNNHDQNELDRFESQYRDLWEDYFRENHNKRKYPLHPWKILKLAREEYAEQENDGDWPCMEKRYALRVVKDEYAEKWREYSENFEPE